MIPKRWSRSSVRPTTARAWTSSARPAVLAQAAHRPARPPAAEDRPGHSGPRPAPGTGPRASAASTVRASGAGAGAACSTVVTGTSSVIPGSLPHGSDITDRAWHDSYVPVVFLIAIVVVLVGIFFAATGRGGELAYE